MKGPVLGSNHSTEVSLGQLKEKMVRSGRKLLLATTSTVSAWGGSSSCTSERRRLGLRQRGLSRSVRRLISKRYSSLKILSAGERSSARVSSRKFNPMIVNYPLFQTCNQSFLLKIRFCLALWFYRQSQEKHNSFAVISHFHHIFPELGVISSASMNTTVERCIR